MLFENRNVFFVLSLAERRFKNSYLRSNFSFSDSLTPFSALSDVLPPVNFGTITDR